MSDCYVSAWDTIARDFSFLPILVASAAKVLSNSIVLFFGGVIVTLVVWRGQTKLSFRLRHDEEFRLLCREFLKSIDEALLKTKHKEPVVGSPRFLEMIALCDEIRMYGVLDVSTAASRVRDAVGVAIGDIEKEYECSDRKKRPAVSAVFFERHEFVKTVARRSRYD